jgi:hypothetical protein
VSFVQLGVSHIFVARDAAPTAIRWMNDAWGARRRRRALSFIAAGSKSHPFLAQNGRGLEARHNCPVFDIDLFGNTKRVVDLDPR